jgi:hypothetical protein
VIEELYEQIKSLEEEELEEEGGGDGGGGEAVAAGHGGGGSYGSDDSITNDSGDRTFWAGKQTGKKKAHNPLTTGLTSQGGNKYNAFNEELSEDFELTQLVEEEKQLRAYFEEQGMLEMYDNAKTEYMAEVEKLNKYDDSLNEMYDDFEKRSKYIASKVKDAEQRKGEFSPKPGSRQKSREMNKKLIDLVGGHEDYDTRNKPTKVGPAPEREEPTRTHETQNSLVHYINEYPIMEASFSEDPTGYVKAAVQQIVKRNPDPKTVELLKRMITSFQEGDWQGVVRITEPLLSSGKNQGWHVFFPVLNYAYQKAGIDPKKKQQQRTSFNEPGSDELTNPGGK